MGTDRVTLSKYGVIINVEIMVILIFSQIDYNKIRNRKFEMDKEHSCLYKQEGVLTIERKRFGRTKSQRKSRARM